MEVHKHPHHVAHKKKFGEYLLEFSMLFLAVFLGFLAENLREHQVNSTKEKEYMVSMLTDLKRDTFYINRTIDFNKLLIRGEDSALHFLKGNLNDRDSTDMALIYFYKYCVYLEEAPVADGTITQLKNNGDLRLVRNKEVASKITNYYSIVAETKGQGEAVRGLLLDNSKQAGKIFNYFGNEEFIDSADQSEQFTALTPVSNFKKMLSKSGGTMLTTDMKDLAPFMTNLDLHAGYVVNYILFLKMQKDYAAGVIKTIRKNYHLEDE